MKKQLIFLSVISVLFVASAVEVTDVKARQRWPWNSLVDIDFVVTTNGTETVSDFYITVSGTYDSGLKSLSAKKFIVPPLAVAGTNRVTWLMSADYPSLQAKDLALKVTAVELNKMTPLYLVIDLSGGAVATAYPLWYTSQAPDVSANTCRTTELWLRRIVPGTFMLGNPSWGANYVEVTLTHPFYIGMFEVTQRQWELVMGSNPSFFINPEHYATRPVEQATYSMMRGSDLGLNWPASRDVDGNSFVGRLRERTGIKEFDLPTDAQWEYACRAGTTGTWNVEGADWRDLARCQGNGGYLYIDGGYVKPTDQYIGVTNATAKVGSYLPNAWGLYDMHGNVYEFCVDRALAQPDPDATVDPIGPVEGENRIKRSGGWDKTQSSSYSYFRSVASAPTTKSNIIGLRISVTEW